MEGYNLCLFKFVWKCDTLVLTSNDFLFGVTSRPHPERDIYEQLSHYFENTFQPFLSAFRPGFGCSTALLKIIEDWKKAIDCNQYTAAVLMDLSKASDCLPHDLLILKLEAYGFSKSALNVMYSYLSERKQCVQVGVDFSTWKNIYDTWPCIV
jgi:hypothetical protein